MAPSATDPIGFRIGSLAPWLRLLLHEDGTRCYQDAGFTRLLSELQIGEDGERIHYIYYSHYQSRRR